MRAAMIIRKRAKTFFSRDRLSGEDRYFAEPEYSCDNAAGIAVLTQMCECGTK